MPDIVTSGQGLFVPGQTGVDAPQLNAILGNAVIQPSFITGKTPTNAPAVTDAILLARANGTLVQITYANLSRAIIGGSVSPGSSLINGDMSTWQRNITFSTGATSSYGPDKWKFNTAGGTARLTMSQLTPSGLTAVNPAYFTPKNALRLTVTTAETPLLATDFYAVEQIVERQIARILFDQVHSAQVFIRPSISGIFTLYLCSSDGLENYIVEMNVQPAQINTWVQFQFPNIPLFPQGTGNWGTLETDACYRFGICIGSGSNFTSGTLGAWKNDTSKLASTNQVNFVAANNNTLDIVFAQHEPGVVSNPILFVPFDIQILRCKRYYRKSYDYLVYAGSLAGTGYIQGLTLGAANSSVVPNTLYDVPMRTAGTRTYYSPATGASGKIRDAAGDLTFSSDSAFTTGIQGITCTTNFSAGSTFNFQYITDADF